MRDACKMLVWDSEHWGFPVALLNGDRLTEDLAKRAISWCEEHEVKCLYFAGDGVCGRTLQLADANGFKFVDVRIDMERGLQGSLSYKMSGVCREAQTEDLPILERLARAAHEDTRFFKDLNFDRDKAVDLYARWIERDLRENKVFAGTAPANAEKLLGYISVSTPGGDTGRIGLVAVAREARGQGVGRLMVEQAVAWCRSRGARSVKVATQGTNIPALRLYESCGFKVSDVKIWFHRWFES